MRNKMLMFGTLVFFLLGSIYIFLLGNSFTFGEEYDDCAIEIEIIDIDTYMTLYKMNTLNNKTECAKKLMDLEKTRNSTIKPLRVFVNLKKHGVDIEYGGYLLAEIDDKKIKSIISNSVCGEYVATKSLIWNFNKYFISIDILDNKTISLAIRGNLQFDFGGNILLKKDVFTDTNRIELSKLDFCENNEGD